MDTCGLTNQEYRTYPDPALLPDPHGTRVAITAISEKYGNPARAATAEGSRLKPAKRDQAYVES